MSKTFETVVKNFSGLSSETKPTIAAGNDIPNGSRWREVDTGKTYFYNTASGKWHEVGQELPAIAGASPVVDVRVLGVLEQMLITLNKIEYHLMLASDADLTNDGV